MSQIAAGAQIFHEGTPVELLFRIRIVEDKELWRCRVLFDAPREIERLFVPRQKYGTLHTRKTP